LVQLRIAVLCRWAKQQKTTLEQLNQIIGSSAEEILFDLTQSAQVGFYLAKAIA
jgi:hypothetical protein